MKSDPNLTLRYNPMGDLPWSWNTQIFFLLVWYAQCDHQVTSKGNLAKHGNSGQNIVIVGEPCNGDAHVNIPALFLTLLCARLCVHMYCTHCDCRVISLTNQSIASNPSRGQGRICLVSLILQVGGTYREAFL